jgi:mannose-6-phosphate isomerase-like protein (cupin superfamily)
MGADRYTIRKLTELEDMAAKHGYSEMGESRFASRELETDQTGLSHQRLRPNVRQPFAHRHGQAEEVYVVLSGSGRVKLDDDIVEVSELDAIRVAPGVTRAFEAGDAGLELIVFGPRHDGDTELVQGWWAE